MEWHDQAACQGVNAEIFHPQKNKGGVTVHVQTQRAKAFCETCPVTAECLEYALTTELFGIWGGMSARERLKYRRKHGLGIRKRGGRANQASERPPVIDDYAAPDHVEEEFSATTYLEDFLEDLETQES